MKRGTTLTRKTINRVPGISCPHCGQKTITRSSEQVTKMVRELRLVCSNDECNASFLAQLSFVRELRRSGTPTAGVQLPQGPATPAANENVPEPANDDAPPPAAAVDDPMTG